MLQHPQVATRSCEDCQKWQYDDETGLRKKMRGTDKPIPRDPRSLPCRMPGEYNGTACPKGNPTDSAEFAPHNLAAYEHNRRCAAVGRFPDDSIVERNAWVISEVLAQWDRMQRNRLTALLLSPTR